MGMSSSWEGYSDWQQSERMWQERVVNLTLMEVEQAALRIERDAKLLVPVDTGKLRGSLSTTISKTMTTIDAEIGTDVEYGPAVEFGTSRQGSQPYLIPSFDRNTQLLFSAIEKVMRG